MGGGHLVDEIERLKAKINATPWLSSVADGVAALVVAGDPGAVAARGRAPFTAWMLPDEIQDASRCVAGAQSRCICAAEERNGLVGDLRDRGFSGRLGGPDRAPGRGTSRRQFQRGPARRASSGSVQLRHRPVAVYERRGSGGPPVVGPIRGEPAQRVTHGAGPGPRLPQVWDGDGSQFYAHRDVEAVSYFGQPSRHLRGSVKRVMHPVAVGPHGVHELDRQRLTEQRSGRLHWSDTTLT
jgi:hypothetical protein